MTKIERLQQAAEAYYNGDKPLMDDATYDVLYEQTKAEQPDHSFFKTVGAPPSALFTKVKHAIPMGSLDKVKEAKSKWPHLKLSHLQFSVFDVDLEKPVWRAEFKNWPLISYLKKREEPKTVEVTVDAISGKLLSYKESAEEKDEGEEEPVDEPPGKQ